MCDRPEKVKHETWLSAELARQWQAQRDSRPEHLIAYPCDEHFHVGHQKGPRTLRQRLRASWRQREIR